MAYEGQGNAVVLPQRAASALLAYQWVGPLVAGSQLDETVIPGASGAVALGITRASHAQGDAAEVIVYGVAKALIGASVGAGAALAVGQADEAHATLALHHRIHGEPFSPGELADEEGTERRRLVECRRRDRRGFRDAFHGTGQT